MQEIIVRAFRLKLCLTATLACWASTCHAENWTRFRGPTAMGVAQDDPRLPDRWSTTDNVKWAAEIPGWGWSSPIVWDGKVFVTSVHSDDEYEKPKKGLYSGMGRPKPPAGVHHWMVYCLDLNSGDVIWKHQVHEGEPPFPRHQKSTYASETPATDGQRVYVLFGDLGLYCFDIAGEPLWSHPIEAKTTMFGYGAAASPVVHEDKVIMVYDNHEDSYIAAFDSRTGKPVWRTDRDERSTWATPLVWTNDLRTEVVVPGKRRIRSYDLGGGLLWEMRGQMSNLVIPSPFASLGMVYIASGYVGDRDRPVYAIKPGATGDITPVEEKDEKADEEEDDDNEEKEEANNKLNSSFVSWYQPQAGPYNTSPIVYGDLYYTLLDRGFLTCHDARTGEEVYGKRRFPQGASFTSSPWAYNGKLYCLSEDGDTFVVAAGREFDVIGTNSLDEFCMASPAVSDGHLLIRTASKLYCIAETRDQ